MRKMGYWETRGDYTPFIKHSPEGKVTTLLLYVDHIIVTEDDNMEQQHLKERLARDLRLKTRED